VPLPKTTDVGKVISFLKKENPKMFRKQMIAIAMNQTGKSNKSKKKKDNRGAVAYAQKLHKKGK